MTRSVVALALSGLFLWAAPAEAKCKSPGVAFAPASNTMTKGVSWVFVPTGRTDATEIRVVSKVAVNSDVHVVSANETFTTYQVTVSSEEVGRIGTLHYDVVADSGYRPMVASYTVPHQDFIVPTGPVALGDARVETDQWTCSHTNAIVATPSVGASAYRLEWASSETSFRAGDVKTLVVPWSMDAFWGRDSAPPQIKLGHLNCFGETISEAELSAGVYLGVTALHTGDEPSPTDPIEVRLADPVVVVDLGPVADTLERINEPLEPLHCGNQPAPPDPARVAFHCGYQPAPPAAAIAGPSHTTALLGIIAGLLLGLLGARRMRVSTRERLDAWSVPQLAVLAAAIPAALSQSSAFAGCTSSMVALGAFAIATAASVLAAWVQLNR